MLMICQKNSSWCHEKCCRTICYLGAFIKNHFYPSFVHRFWQIFLPLVINNLIIKAEFIYAPFSIFIVIRVRVKNGWNGSSRGKSQFRSFLGSFMITSCQENNFNSLRKCIKNAPKSSNSRNLDHKICKWIQPQSVKTLGYTVLKL